MFAARLRAPEEVGLYSEKHTPPDTVTHRRTSWPLVEDRTRLRRNRRHPGPATFFPPQVEGQESPSGSRPGQRTSTAFTPERRLSLTRSAPWACAPVPPGGSHGECFPAPRSRIEVSGKEAVVVGRSDIVGKPMAMLLLQRECYGDGLPFEDA